MRVNLPPSKGRGSSPAPLSASKSTIIGGVSQDSLRRLGLECADNGIFLGAQALRRSVPAAILAGFTESDLSSFIKVKVFGANAQEWGRISAVHAASGQDFTLTAEALTAGLSGHELQQMRDSAEWDRESVTLLARLSTKPSLTYGEPEPKTPTKKWDLGSRFSD